MMVEALKRELLIYSSLLFSELTKELKNKGIILNLLSTKFKKKIEMNQKDSKANESQLSKNIKQNSNLQ
jgi:hypothetical protein